ncbi:carbohydrate ABC transporter permease [Frondihabitans australicus]|uniref:Multiple sugar transport system permease protein n=1 Tax=Frondihabitans australicus TaxID=386892 RepID=A0A495IC52_9MICO|nr:sugar ABC transporter permease [Frondihabitans australicus]RKR73502.1 multiple sugar transport system permease protein [Frondihabitans australicus]
MTSVPTRSEAPADGRISVGGRRPSRGRGAGAVGGTGGAGRSGRSGRSRRESRVAPWAFVTPSLVLFSVFAFAPILASVVLSFENVQVFGGGTFVGLQNYQTMLTTPLFWEAVKNTLIFTVGTVPTSAALGLLLAIMLNRKLPGRGIIRSLYFLPMVVSGVAVSLVFIWMFDSNDGVVDAFLQAIGLPRIGWLTSPDWAMVTVILAVVWGRIGFCMVTYLAALQGINPSLLEAAQIDGAGSWRRFTGITWPLLNPTTYMLIVLNVVFSLQAFDVIYVMTGGGPGFSTTVLIQYIFRSAFTNGQMGYASAIGVFLVVVLLLLTLLRNRIAKRTEEES